MSDVISYLKDKLVSKESEMEALYKKVTPELASKIFDSGYLLVMGQEWFMKRRVLEDAISVLEEQINHQEVLVQAGLA